MEKLEVPIKLLYNEPKRFAYWKVGKYLVSWSAKRKKGVPEWKCDCKDYFFRVINKKKTSCKHIDAVAPQLKKLNCE